MFGMEKNATDTDSPRAGRGRGRRLLATGIAAVLLAGSAAPAFAHDRDWGGRGHGWYGGPRHGHSYDSRPYYGHRYYGGRHHGDDALFFGLGAITGLATGAILAAPPAPRYYYPPAVTYAPPPAYLPPPSYGASSYESGYCREYQRNIYIGGTVQRSYGTACLQPDGSWRTVNESPE
jgi:hypothetical protein